MNSQERQVGQLSGLTNSQSLVWMSQRLAPESPLFNMAHRFDIATEIAPEHFQSALQGVVDGSDALRTVFLESTGSVQQAVLDQLSVDVAVIDFSAEADPDDSVQRWIDERARQVLDLASCCHDSALLKIGHGHWVWFLNIHHLVADAWSISLICKQLGRCYELAQASQQPALEGLPAYQDYLQYEREWRESQPFRDAKQYWQQHSQGPSGLVALYGQKGSRSSTQSSRLTFGFGEERSQRLNALAQQPGYRSLSPHLSRFNLLACVVFAYLYRVGQGHQVTLGTPAHNRSSLAFRETIGLFIETLPFSSNVDSGETFSTLFSKVARESQYFLKNAQPGCSNPQLARTFNVVFNYINTSFGDFAGTPMTSTLVHSNYVDSGHDLRIQIHDVGDSGQYMVHFDCNIGTYEPVIRDNMRGHFLALLDAFLDNPDTDIDAVGITGAQEQRRLLEEFNEHSSAVHTATVLQSFQAQVNKDPTATAAKIGSQCVTYADLDTTSDQLAAQLIRRGVTAGAVVGICMRRSIDFLTAVLAVLKSGAVFVPLEARLPEQRLAFIARDAGMVLVLTEQPLLHRGDDSPTSWLSVASELELAQQSDAPLALPDVSGQQSAYIIYTSGSTGYPKGVVVTHQGLAAYVHWAHASFADQARCDFPLYSSIGFDLTITSLFVPLISGAAVKIYPEPGRGPDLAVLEVFEDDDVDVVKLTPAHLALVLEQPRPVQRIRALILGGENLTTELANQTLASLGAVDVYNEYGPTEAVVGCMRHRFDPATDTGSSVPIGVPASHHRIYLLDSGGRPVPLGVTGEIYIAGECLAKGYLNRDEDNAARFIADPFHPGDKMYRTGDLGRFNTQSLIEYLGRADEQLKIRGVRVEPAEISRAITAFAGVSDCVIDVVEAAAKPPVDDVHYCSSCGLSSEYPGVSFDAQGVCNLCSDFESYRDRAQIYFDDIAKLRELLAVARDKRGGDYDCIMLLSGGKDSTYALYRLAEQGPRILALTLDNGFISNDTKVNIRKVVDSIGVDHRFVGTPAMNEIFRDSLERHSNVCQGCFKTIYTLAMQTALEEGIPYIVTGLSRGQFFETRLTPELFREDSVDLIAIERTVLEARRAYHGVDDAISRCLDVSMFDNDQVFEKVGFIDFYRYCDVSLEEVYRFLSEKAPWIRPSDTGRSTNCTINEAGIYVHRRKQSYHNYALPYSWDVRMGHKTREDALEELNDQIDVVSVHKMLDDIGYTEEIFQQGIAGKRLVAYYTSEGDIDESALREHCARHLPDAMVPSFLVAMQQFPLTGNGKIDYKALPAPHLGRPQVQTVYLAPRDPVEEQLASIWREVLGATRVGIADNYYALGGDSISAIQIAAKAQQADLALAAIDIFEHQTIEQLARHLQDAAAQGDSARGAAQAPEAFSLAALDQAKLNKVAEMLSRKGK